MTRSPEQIGMPSTLGEGDVAGLEHDGRPAQAGDVGEGIAGDGHQVGGVAGGDAAEIVAEAEHLGGDRGGGAGALPHPQQAGANR